MWVVRDETGYVFGGLTPFAVDTLKAIPMLLESSDLRVRKRLMPDTYEDAEAEAQWRRHSAPELERLFLSRANLVRRDLEGLRRLKKTDTWVLAIEDRHQNAWLSSLNAARLALFEMNDLTAEHMERDGIDLCSKKQREAVERIHLMAEMQSVLLGDVEVDEDDLPEPGSPDLDDLV
jgi:Domain of unknown function (DUF2017)